MFETFAHLLVSPEAKTAFFRCDVSVLVFFLFFPLLSQSFKSELLQKGGVPAAPSGTATLLRLSPSHHVCPRR